MSKRLRMKFMPLPVGIIWLAAALVLLMPVTPVSGGAPAEETKLIAADVALFDEYGFSVAIDGDSAVVGSICDDDNGECSGSAYVFVRDANGWTEQAKLTPNDGYYYDRFGYSVSISGNTVLIGASWDNENGYVSGSSYVFVRSGTTWSQQAKLIPSDNARADSFGRSVSIDGNTAIIGASGHDDGCQEDYLDCNTGSAYIFVRSGGDWSQQAELTASDAAPEDQIGFSVAISGDTVIVGGRSDDPSCLSDPDPSCKSGFPYVFVRSGTNWSQQAKLTASDATARDRFGAAVAISGDTVVVGAYDADDACPEDPQCNSGSAYLFQRSGTNWSQQAKLTSKDAAQRDRFGAAVSVSGDTVVVGAHNKNVRKGQSSQQGASYVFLRSDDSWEQKMRLTSSEGSNSDPFFGRSVSVDGSTIVVGAPAFVSNKTGSAFAYELAAQKGKKKR